MGFFCPYTVIMKKCVLCLVNTMSIMCCRSDAHCGSMVEPSRHYIMQPEAAAS